MKQFTSAAKRSEAVANPVELTFSINDTELTASPPSSGQITIFMASQASRDVPTVARGMLKFMEILLGEEDYEWFVESLDRDDFDFDLVLDIIEWMTEEWTTRPTSSASGSPSSRGSTGKRSTAKPRTKASTRST